MRGTGMVQVRDYSKPEEPRQPALGDPGSPDPRPLTPDPQPPTPSPSFPATRYMGSKRALLPWIWASVAELRFDSVLDAFSGSGCVAHFFKRQGKRVLAEAVADHVTDALKGVINNGTGRGADIGRPDGSAGKTGSTENNADAWFVGYTPALSTAIWMGYSDSNTRSLRNIKGVSTVYGGTIPASTWKDYMGQALKNAPPADFPKPAPLAGDIGAGPRRAPEDLRPTVVEPIYVDPPVTVIPAPPTTVFVPPPPSTLPVFPFLTTSSTVPRPGVTFPTTTTTRRTLR